MNARPCRVVVAGSYGVHQAYCAGCGWLGTESASRAAAEREGRRHTGTPEPPPPDIPAWARGPGRKR